MRAGRLNKRIAIVKPPGWDYVLHSWAAIEPKIDSSYDNPDSLKQDVPVVVRMRARPGVAIYPGMRICYKTKIYVLISFAETLERGREWLINCREYIGEPASFTQNGGGVAVNITARIFVAIDYDGGVNETAERDTVIAALKSEFAQSPVDGDIITIRGADYTIVGLADDGDDGTEYKFVVREP